MAKDNSCICIFLIIYYCSWLGMLPGTWAYVSAGAFGRAIIVRSLSLPLSLTFSFFSISLSSKCLSNHFFLFTSLSLSNSSKTNRRQDYSVEVASCSPSVLDCLSLLWPPPTSHGSQRYLEFYTKFSNDRRDQKSTHDFDDLPCFEFYSGRCEGYRVRCSPSLEVKGERLCIKLTGQK